VPQPSKTTTVCSCGIDRSHLSTAPASVRQHEGRRAPVSSAPTRYPDTQKSFERPLPQRRIVRRVVSLSVIQRRLAVRCTPRGCALLCTNQMMCSRSPSDGCSDAMLMKWDFSPKQLSAYTCVRASVRMAHARYCVRVRGTALRSSSAGATSSDIKCKSFDRAHARVLRSAPTDMHVPSGLCGLVSRSAFGCRPRFLRRSRLLLAAVCLHLSARAEFFRAEQSEGRTVLHVPKTGYKNAQRTGKCSVQHVGAQVVRWCMHVHRHYLPERQQQPTPLGAGHWALHAWPTLHAGHCTRASTFAITSMSFSNAA
jgi:hypothetical protein